MLQASKIQMYEYKNELLLVSDKSIKLANNLQLEHIARNFVKLH